jgi:hypothetical protein
LRTFSRNRKSARKRVPKTRKPEQVDDLLSNSSRIDVNGWIFAHSAGDPYQVGFQNGSLLGSEIVDAVEAVKLMGEGGYRRNWQFFCENAMNLFWPKLPEEYRQEIQGIVDGVASSKAGNVQLRDVVALNGYFDTVSYHYWLKSRESQAISPLARAEHCSAFIVTGDKTDGQVLLAHNTWFQYLPGARYNVILDICPTNGKRFVMQTMAGTISSGTDWYLSESGLVVAETTISGMTTFNPDGVPYFARARKAIQYSENIGDWVKTMVKENNGGYADDWLIGNVKTGEIGWLELGTFNHKLELTHNGVFVGCNIAMNKEVQSETNLEYSDKSLTCTARQARLRELLEVNEGKLNVDAAKALLADHHDSYSKTDSPSRNSICGHIETDARGIPEWEYGPYYPGGCFDGKVTDTELAKGGAFWAHWGRPCGTPFEAGSFLRNHPEYEWQKPRLKDIAPYPWTLVRASSPPKWPRAIS